MGLGFDPEDGRAMVQEAAQQLRGILTAYGLDKLVDQGLTLTFAPGTKIQGVEVEGSVTVRVAT